MPLLKLLLLPLFLGVMELALMELAERTKRKAKPRRR